MARQLTFDEKKAIAINILSDIREDCEATYKKARDMGDNLIHGEYTMKRCLNVIKSIDQTIAKLVNPDEE